MHIKISVVTSTDLNNLHISYRTKEVGILKSQIFKHYRPSFVSADDETKLFSQDASNKLHTNHFLWVAMGVHVICFLSMACGLSIITSCIIVNCRGGATSPVGQVFT